MAQDGIRLRLEDRLTASIRRTRREATILFTDVEGSTRHWESQGDIRGRLAVDRHNRLVFPLVRRHRGRVVKTIGDSVMASFRRPEDGVRAAVAIQQALAREREANRDFSLKVRIGVHTGQAIVEPGDVYGNAVNAAARVESCAAANQVLVSGATVRRLGKGAGKRFAIRRGDRVTPRGQSRPITLYHCDWDALEDMVGGDGRNALVMPREKGQMVAFALGTLVGLWYLYAEYVRYILIDRDVVAVLVLNPLDQPLIGSVFGLVVVAASFGLWRMRRKPHGLLRLLRSTFSFSLVFVFVHLVFGQLPVAWAPTHYWDTALHESEHLFVEVRQSRAPIRTEPARDAEILRHVRRGTLLLLADVRADGEVTWNRVLIGEDEYGWIPRVLPPEIGIPERRVSLADKFYFRWNDLYALVLGLLGLLWGLLDFRLRPA